MWDEREDDDGRKKERNDDAGRVRVGSLAGVFLPPQVTEISGSNAYLPRRRDSASNHNSLD